MEFSLARLYLIDIGRPPGLLIHLKGPLNTRLLFTRVLPTPLSLTDRNAILFAPLGGHLPKFEVLELVPGVPQGVFVQQAFE
jgi:hypothetical protein